MEDIFKSSKWIWVDDKTKENDFVLFRKKINLVKPPKKAIVRVAAEGEYTLYVNGKVAVFFGGLNRESERGKGYYDETDIAKYLTKGNNVIGAIVNYKGKSGENVIACEASGFIFECEALGVYSDESFTAFRNEAFATLKDEPEVATYSGEFNVWYDATREFQLTNVFTVLFESSIFTPSVVLGAYPCPPYHELIKRPIPLFEFSNAIKSKKWQTEIFNGKTTVTLNLGERKYVAPIFTVLGTGGEVLEIRSADEKTSGAYGDEKNEYCGARFRYTCKNGLQTFEVPMLIPADRLVITFPNGLKLKKLGYRESVYRVAAEGKIIASRDDRVALFCEKAVNTLKMCMRDTFYNSPHRERAMKLGDFSQMAAAASVVFNDEAIKLVKKTLTDILNYSVNDVIFSGVVGNNARDIPSQALLFLSEYGALATYYNRTGDKGMIEKFFPIIIKYLEKWEMSEDGLVAVREGEAHDYLYNVDSRIIENAVYYSALKFADRAADILQNADANGFLAERIGSIAGSFDEVFFKDGCYKSGNMVDERANAWSVLAELCKPENFESVSKVLAASYNCSMYQEGFVEEALCKMNCEKEAMHRFFNRYGEMLKSSNPTLSENFTPVGTACHGYAAYPLAVFFRHIVGVRFINGEKVEITPNLLALGDIKFSAPVINGVIGGVVRKNKEKAEIIIDNNYNGCEITAILSASKIGSESKRAINKLSKGRNRL